MTVHRATAIAIRGRGVLIEGAPGTGKSSLALALIDRGAQLIGDDAVMLAARDGRLYASPPPHVAGLLEVRNVGLLAYPTARDVAVALVLRLDPEAPRFVEAAGDCRLFDCAVPMLALWPGSPVLALRAEAALRRHGLA